MGGRVSKEDILQGPLVKFIPGELLIWGKTNTLENTWNKVGTKRNVKEGTLKTVNWRGVIENS